MLIVFNLMEGSLLELMLEYILYDKFKLIYHIDMLYSGHDY